MSLSRASGQSILKKIRRYEKTESGWTDALTLLITVGLIQTIGRCCLTSAPGHAGAMRQARQLGKELYAGIHSDEDILLNKGPAVMTLDERWVHRQCAECLN
jgi:hypothetical protein